MHIILWLKVTSFVVAWIAALFCFNLSLEMISRANSIENIIGVMLITWVVLAAATTKGFTSYKFKKKREDEK